MITLVNFVDKLSKEVEHYHHENLLICEKHAFDTISHSILHNKLMHYDKTGLAVTGLTTTFVV